MPSDTWKLLNDARKFIEAEYSDPSAAPDGEWLAKEARPIHDRICTALANYSASIPAEIGGVVERLRATGGRGQGGPIKVEAASALLSLSARVGELEGVSRAAGEWEDLHRELFDAVMACVDPEGRVCGLHPGPEREALEAVIAAHKGVHAKDGPYASEVSRAVLAAELETVKGELAHIVIVKNEAIAGWREAEAKLAGGEAVAWRVTVETHDYITPWPSQAESWRRDGYYVEPLYAHPAPSLCDGSGEAGDWRIDTSAGSPILVYQDCSVIQDEQAEYVLGLIRAAHTSGEVTEASDE